MYRTDSEGSVPAKPAPSALGTEGYFEDGTPGGSDGTEVDADWLNMLQGELENLRDIDGAVSASKTDHTQLATAIQAYIAGELAAQSVPFPRGYISGFLWEIDSGDVAHDVSITAGAARDTGHSVNMESGSAMVKRIDANWVAGTGNGGFPSALSIAADTRYRLFAIATAAGAVDFGWDTSATAANLLADATGYTKYRQIGWFKTDGSSNLYYQMQDPADASHVYLDKQGEDHAQSEQIPNDSTVTREADGGFPGVTANLKLSMRAGSSTSFELGIYVHSKDLPGTPTTSGVPVISLEGGLSDELAAASTLVLLDASAQFDYHADSVGGSPTTGDILGWTVSDYFYDRGRG